jgi:hypothetical protein
MKDKGKESAKGSPGAAAESPIIKLLKSIIFVE